MQRDVTKRPSCKKSFHQSQYLTGLLSSTALGSKTHGGGFGLLFQVFYKGQHKQVSPQLPVQWHLCGAIALLLASAVSELWCF